MTKCVNHEKSLFFSCYYCFHLYDDSWEFDAHVINNKKKSCKNERTQQQQKKITISNEDEMIQKEHENVER